MLREARRDGADRLDARASDRALAADLPSLRAARRLSRPAVRRRLLVITAAVVLLLAVVVRTAVASLGEVSEANAAVASLTTAQQQHQDADMQHDALRADVLQAMLVGRGIGPETPDEVRADVRDHEEVLRANLASIAGADLPESAREVVQRVRGDQERYAASARALVDIALADPAAAERRLPTFLAASDRLEQELGRVTDDLDALADETEERAAGDQRTAEQRIVLAALLALVGIVGLGYALHRLGDGLALLVSLERGVAETLQRSLLPEAVPDLPGWRLAVRYLPGASEAQVGGDWYDVLALPDGRVGLVMGDVSGHDLRSATLMGQLRSALRAYAIMSLPPAAVLEHLNRFGEGLDTVPMATCVYLIVDVPGGTVSVCNAGHLPPLVVAPSGQTRYLENAPGPPLGVLPDATYTQHAHPLEPGSTLVLFTDGLVERRTESIDDSLERLRGTVASAPRAPEALCQHVLDEFFGEDPPADDVALLVVRSGRH